MENKLQDLCLLFNSTNLNADASEEISKFNFPIVELGLVFLMEDSHFKVVILSPLNSLYLIVATLFLRTPPRLWFNAKLIMTVFISILFFKLKLLQFWVVILPFSMEKEPKLLKLLTLIHQRQTMELMILKILL